ncbi:CxC2 domain-containing protein [Mycena sanguinolenta]|uniref:CxC2 domain-containing protein n=1 Tax=Mycena sanguinolenta TaxID=230812 RepID=A0A8H6ZHM7_9AGAR|nr:CxC2 domain-containing protein [Mycena sanguinolenta]
MARSNRNRRAGGSTTPASTSVFSAHVFDVSDLMASAEAPIATYVDRLAPNGRDMVRETIRVDPPSPLKRARLGDRQSTDEASTTQQSASVDDPDRYTMAQDVDDFMVDDDPPLSRLPRLPNPKRFEPSDKTLSKWMRLLRDTYLSQMFYRDGCGDASLTVCPRCKDPASTPYYRCQEYSGGLLLCEGCCLDSHIENPLHVIHRWTGVFFAKTSLKALGQRIQFGHPPREHCANPQLGYRDFVVLHDNGIHSVHVDFCGCDSAARTEPYLQLLRAGWYPASDERPQTAATFLLLDKFHLTTLQAKMTAYDFYTVLERLTDNTGVKPPDRYQVFLRMARQYRHLLMLKRAGRGHDLSGVWGTAPGELAIQCPVCPDPDVNLPAGWEQAPPEDQFLYILFLALDACFRLKRRMISSEIKDPALGSGWAYVTENTPYRHYLLTVTDQKEMSTCSGLAALDYANTKFSRGYSTTGVGMGVCARHEFVQPTGVGDLQKGERFANMDYIFGSILRHKDPRIRKIISYDIVCQWWKLLHERLKELPPLVRITIILELFRFVIPKMHIHAHTLECQVQFSLNLVPGSGQTDGEGIERPWASIGAIASSTRVSGPGARHDALDDHWNFWNWLKTIGLPVILRRRLDAARKEQASQREAFELFSIQQAARVPVWKKMVEDFEAGRVNKNPYQMKILGMTEAEVRLKFATEEEEEAKKGIPALHEVTPSSFVAAGLELEEQQRRVRVQAELKKAGTTAMVINMKALRGKLNRGIAKFRKLQATYTPAAIQALARRVAPAEELAEDVPLMLPSSLTAAEREGGGCVKGVLEIEDSMREAQCRAALPRLRNQLHIKSRFLLYKKHNARHQGMNTRSRTLVARNESKIRLHSEKFQMAWRARLRISNGDRTKVGWPELRKEDIRCMQDAEQLSRNAEKRRRANERRLQRESEMREDGLLPELDEEDDDMVTRGGENMREVSWIWTMAGTAGTDEELEDEWSKAWARSRRWTEEVRLLEEEWRRLPVTYAHRERLWIKRTVAVPVGSIPVAEAEGKIAYASKQSQMYRDLAARAEITRTEAKVARGKKRSVWAPTWDPLLGADENQRARDDDGEEDEGVVDDEDDDERGDIDSDEELLMGGEVDDE